MIESQEVLLKKIFTKEDCISTLEEISQLQQLVFKSQESLSKKSENLVSRNLYQFFLFLETKGKIGLSQKEQFDFLEELKDCLKNLSVLKLEIAFLPSQKTIEKIDHWLKKEVGKEIILDIYFNQMVVGGAILEYGGKYLNLSLVKEIDKIFSASL